MSEGIVAGLEAGGTKFICGLGRADGTLLWRESVATAKPAETIAAVAKAFAAGAAKVGQQPTAAGIASFGPIDLDPRSGGFGAIGTTPKAGWAGVNLRSAVADVLGCPVTIDTDVTGAGMAEARFGVGKGVQSLVYLTVGTGVGGALIINGEPHHGPLHPEMGHITLARHISDEDFEGVCPFHGDCLEGLASGPAIQARTGKALAMVAAAHPVWRILADYLAQACLTVHLIATPDRIILGGGVMANKRLFALVHERVVQRNNGYSPALADPKNVAEMIQPPALGDNAGLIGAFLLAGRPARPL